MIAKIFKALALMLILLAPEASAQIQQNIGIQADQSYSNSQIDNVNLLTGNVTDSIQIASYPQKGNLPPLNISYQYNSNPWYREATCDSYSEECVVYYTNLTNSIEAITPAPFIDNYSVATPIVNMQLLYDSGDICDSPDPELLIECVLAYGNDVGAVFMEYNRTISLYDDTGAQHSLYFDATNPNWARASDGSGYAMYQESNYDAYGFFAPQTPTNATLYDGNGNYRTIPFDGSSSNAILTDVYGNSIGATTTPVPGQQPSFVDSVGRVFPPTTSDSTPTGLMSHCPQIGNALQPLYSATKWSAPGINGGTSDYIVCYTGISIHPGFFDVPGFYDNIGTPPPFHCDDYFYNFWNIDAPDTQFTIADGTEPFNNVIACDQEFSTTLIQAIVLPNGSYWGFLYDAGQTTPCNNMDETCTTVSYGTLQTVILPSGAQISYNYANITNTWAQAYFMNYRELTQRSETDVNGTVRQTQYQYTVNNGLPYTVETDALGNDTGHIFGYSYQDPSTSGIGDPYEYQTSWHETETDHYQGSAVSNPILLSKDIVSYVNASTVRKQSSTHYENGIETGSMSYSYPSYNTYEYYSCSAFSPTYCHGVYGGTILRERPSSTVVSNGDGTVISQTSDTPLDVAQPVYAGENILNKLSSHVVTDGSGNTIAETDYGYDEGATGNPGSNTSTSGKLANGTVVKSTFSYNSDGTVSDSFSPSGTDTHVNSYQCNGIYPQSITAAFGSTTTLPETTTSTVDCDTGKVLSATDANGITTSYDYNDSLLRPTRTRTAVGTPQEAWTTYSYPSMNEVDVAQDQAAAGDGILTSTYLMDGVGHVTHTTAPGAVQQDFHYNLVGLLDWKSNPYFSANDPTYGKTYYTYDATGRLTKQVQPDTQVLQWCFENVASTGQTNCRANVSSFAGGLWVDKSDESGNRWQQVTDGAGRLVSVVEPTSFETDYSYDALGNLLNVNQHGAGTDTPRVRSFSYDTLSRLITSTNPETGQMCYGTWSGGNCVNGYDANGNIQYKTDARGVQTHYTYDALNRLTGKYYSNDPSSTTNTCYQYDTLAGSTSGANLISRMTAEWTQSESAGTCSSAVPSTGALTAELVTAYDAMGRVKNSRQCALGNCATGGVLFSLTQGYNLAGNTVTWTDGLNQILFTQHYDTAGRLQTLTSSWSDALHPATLFSSQSGTACGSSVQGYNAAGALQNWTLGNNLGVARCYDSRLRVTSETATVP